MTRVVPLGRRLLSGAAIAEYGTELGAAVEWLVASLTLIIAVPIAAFALVARVIPRDVWQAVLPAPVSEPHCGAPSERYEPCQLLPGHEGNHRAGAVEWERELPTGSAAGHGRDPAGGY
jgi:hypothetical protein